MIGNLIGEKAAIEQTKIIIAQIPANDMSKDLYKQIVRQIYDNQLKKYTKYNRVRRRKMAHNLFDRKANNEQK